ncbi:hypothetical protein R1flu_010603 [Riccia fluitans]|uniref:Uncharacterized protein n=1 Tax=Riccia fluitans TaxID=41844 RepID=A0ABD1Z5F5_9MARC
MTSSAKFAFEATRREVAMALMPSLAVAMPQVSMRRSSMCCRLSSFRWSNALVKNRFPGAGELLMATHGLRKRSR